MSKAKITLDSTGGWPGGTQGQFDDFSMDLSFDFYDKYERNLKKVEN